MPAVHQFLENPSKLYTLTTKLPFRNFPEVIYYFMLCNLMPSAFNLNLLACSAITLVANIVCCYFIMKILSLETFKSSSMDEMLYLVPVLLAGYLLTPGQAIEYYQGQINIIANMFLLLSIYYSFKKDEKLAFLFLGCAVVFIITIVLLVPFLLFANIKSRPVKKLLHRMVFFIIPFIPSIVLFLAIPKLITSYFSMNISATVDLNSIFTTGNCSLTKFLATVFNTNITATFVVVAVLIYGISGYVVLKYHVNEIERYMLGVFSMMLVMPDFFGLHFLFIFGILILWFLTKPRSLGIIYRFLFLVITVSFFLWYWDPLSSLVVLAFYFFYITDIVLGIGSEPRYQLKNALHGASEDNNDLSR
ncbi:MAG TPA: hypothetical protein VKM55_16490 [Candidatus Lokiarchaeia archaeon]|nr:hypothetical protein [Candidatus Lokiarchaeia archaeon]